MKYRNYYTKITFLMLVTATRKPVHAEQKKIWCVCSRLKYYMMDIHLCRYAIDTFGRSLASQFLMPSPYPFSVVVLTRLNYIINRFKSLHTRKLTNIKIVQNIEEEKMINLNTMPHSSHRYFR